MVWNSAMLVYQALLLGGYAYAHWPGRFAFRRQAAIHLALLLVAALWLPIGIAQIAPPAPGQEVLWVPLLFTASIGPGFRSEEHTTELQSLMRISYAVLCLKQQTNTNN